MCFVCNYVSPLGNIIMTSDGTYLTRLVFDDGQHLSPLEKHHASDLPVFNETSRWLDIYFSGKNPGFIPDINPDTTCFRKAVYDVLLNIPFGETSSYADVAGEVYGDGNIPKLAPRAIGGAVAHNPVLLIIPCHRIIGSNGNPGGYAAGTDRKIKLLKLENPSFSF